MLRKENKQSVQHSIHQIFGKNLTRLLALSLFSLNTLADISSNELPQGADIVSGDITISSNDNVMNIDQDSQQGIIDWQTFNVGSDATVNFNQPNSSASTLNRVVTDNASQIYGNINANGQVLLVNSSGVYISENGRVETGGIVATTQEINNQEYLDNPDRIILRETDQSGSIENHGAVIANEAYVAMLAPEVRNEGLITANMGEVVLASGREIILSFDDGQITDVITTSSLLNSLIENKLAIEAAGGKVILSATAMNQINGGLINQAGSINVGSTETVAVNEGGRIYLTSNEVVFDGGSQTLANANTQGGEIEVAANDITIEEDARIEASATLNGDGGSIELVAENDITINGAIKADGADEGVGGEILTQGEQVILEDNAQISAKSGENAPIIQQNNIKILENDEIIAQNSNQGNWRIVSAASVWTQTHASVIELALLNANVSETVNADLCVTNCSIDQVGDLVIGDDIILNNRSTTLTQLELTASNYLSLQGTISDEHQNLILEATGFKGLSLGTVADITANQVSFRSAEQLDVSGSVTATGNENTNPLANFIGANMVMAGLIQTSNQTRLGRMVMTALNQINLRPESRVIANGDLGGTVLINARHLDVDGFIQSNGGTGRGGTITLDIEETVDMNQAWIESNGFDAGGTIKIQVRDGPLNMDSTRIQTNASNGRGGTILISGREHTRITSSHIESKGTSQGGEIYLGYDQDNQRIPFSKYLYISKNTIVDARNFNNTNGGFVETSGHVVNILATINVGRGGMWLIDPFDVTISNTASGDSYSANFDPTQTTVLNYASIEASLNSGTDVSITTGSATANTLTVDFPIQPKSYSGATLTLTGGTIDINRDITGDGVDLNLVLNGATIDIDNSISLNGGTLTINNSSGGDIDSGSTISAASIVKNGAGSFTISSTSTMTGSSTINAGTLIATANAFGDEDVVVNTGGTFEIQGFAYSSKGTIFLNGGTLSGTSTTASITNDGAVVLQANSILDVASGTTFTNNANFGDAGNNYGITKNGAGTFIFSPPTSTANRFNGDLVINAGEFQMTEAIGHSGTSYNSGAGIRHTYTGDITVASGATLNINLDQDKTSQDGDPYAGIWFGSDPNFISISGAGSITANATSYSFSFDANWTNYSGIYTANDTTYFVFRTGSDQTTAMSIQGNETIYVYGSNNVTFTSSSHTFSRLSFDDLFGNFSATFTGAINCGSECNDWMEVDTGVTLIFDSSNDFEISRIAPNGSNNAGTIYKRGTGTVSQLVAGAGAYFDGTLNIEAGTWSVGTNGGLGSGSTVNVSSGATINFAGVTHNRSLTLNSSGNYSNTGGNSSFNQNIALGANTNIDVASGTTLTLSGIVSGAYSVTKSGAGTLVMSANNTFTHGLNVDAGTVSVTATQFGLVNNSNFGLVIANGATFSAGGHDIFANNQTQILSTVEIQSGGTMTNSGNYFNRLGNLTLSGGTLTSTGGITTNALSPSVAWTLSDTVTATADSTISGSAEIFNGQGGNGVIFSVSSGATLTVSASLIDGDDSSWSGTGLATGFSKTGLGTLLLSGTNEISSTIAINAGTLEISGTIHTLGESSTDSYVTFTQAITNSGALVLSQDTVNQRLQGIISGTGTLTQQGDNQVVLTATNTYSGNTTISSGSIKLGNYTSTGSVDSSSIINNANLVIDRTTSATIASDISGTGTVNIIYRLEQLIDWGSSDSLLSTYEVIASNATVLDILNRISGGQVHGTSILDGVQTTSGAGVYEKTYDADNETASMWFRWNSGSNYTKQVNILLRQNGTNVEASSTTRQWFNTPSSNYHRLDEGDVLTSPSGTSTQISTSNSTAGYGVRSIDLNVKISFSGNLTYTGTTTLDETDVDQSGSGSAYWRTFYKDTVEFTNTGDIGAVSNAGNLAVASDASFEIGGIISGIGTVRKSGTGILTLSAGNTFTNDIHITGGTLSVTGQLESGTYDGLISNAGTLSIATNYNQTLSGVISGSGSLTKSGSGTLTLSGTNTFNGTVTISAGTLAISNASALGTTSGKTTVSDGATLQISGGITVAENMYVNGSGVSSNGAVYFLSGNNTYSGAIVLQSNTTMTSAAGNQTFSGTINGAYNLSITAAANWTQSAAIGGSSALADYSLTASGNAATSSITANGSIGIDGVDITISSGTLTAGSDEDIILSASGNFINSSGATALSVSGTGRWIVYAADDDSSTFNSLDSNNIPLWSATYSTLSPSSVPSGNRYVFAETSSQTVTFTTTSETITYADSYDLSDNYVITTSGVAGLANVYNTTSSGSLITLETAYSSNPTVTVSANGASNSTSGNLEAGSYTLGISVAGGTLRSGYTLATSETGSITVNQKALTVSGITAANKTYDGDNTSTIDVSSAAFAGLVASDVVSVTATGTFSDANVGTGKTVTLSETMGGTDIGNYSVTAQGSTTADITAKTLTATADAADKTYDGTATATVTLTLSGVVGSDSVSSTNGATFSQSNVGTGITATVNSITLTGDDAGNYTISSGQTDTAAITAKTLTATADAADKTYDGTTTATVTLTLSGVVGSDSVSSTNGATFSQSNVGTGLTATVNSITLTGDDAGNYTISSGQTDTAAITAKALTYTVDASDKTYDGTDTATVTITLSGLVGAETLTASETSTFAQTTVGTGITVTVDSISLVDGTGDADNYSISSGQTDTAAITAKTLTATADAADKTYDGTTTATVTLTLSGVVGSDSVSSTNGATFSQSNVGTGLTATVNSITLTGDDAGNYTISSGQTDTAAITAKALTISGITASNKTYDGDNTATIDYSSAVFTGIVVGDTVTVTATGTFSDENVGTGKTVTLSETTGGADEGNYSITTQGTTTANITAKSLTVSGITADDKTYDGTTTATVNTDSASFTGLVDGDTVSIDTSGVTATFAQSDVGTNISVTLSGLSLTGDDASNYSSTLPSGTTADITAKTLTATADAADKTYDGTATATVTLTLSGVVGSDSVSSTNGATFSQSNVGTGITATVNSITLTGDDAGNYTISSGQTDTAAITAKTLTATADAADKTYDGTTTATVTLTLSGVVGSDSVSSTNGATFSQSNVGTGLTATVNSITLTGDDAGNYTISSGQTDTAAITAKALTYTVDASDKTYDGTDTATVTITLSGLVGAETLTASETSTFAQTTVGTGITVTVDSISLVDGTGDADNYSISSGQTDTAAITAKTLTATADAADKTYDGTTTATVTLTLSGVVGSDSVSSTNGATFSQSNVGTGLTATVNSITLTGDDAGNYTISSGQTDTADITQKALGYNVDASNKTYDGTDTATVTLTLNRLVTGETLTATAIATFDSANVGTRTATVNSITLADGTGDADNYSISTGGTDSASITQKALTYTVDANDKTYDGTRSATATLSLSGLVGSETLDVTNTATFANATAGDDKTVTVTSVNLADGTNGGLAANYSISSGETTTATINKATLNVAPLDDAKFVGEADPAGYNGVIYNGFISGESSSDLGGSTTISRNAGETAGDYTLSLTQALTSDNYTINYGTGTFTIAATTAILVDLVQNNTLYYGSDPTYGSGQSHTISARDIDGALTVTMSGQEATITKSGTTVAVAPLVPDAATTSTAGYYEAGGYNYSVDTADANYSLADGYSIVVDSGEFNITPLEIDVNATVTVGGLTKTYDGNANISGLTTTISSSPVKTGDDVTFAATGTFDSRHVGTSKTVSISMAISGDDANNYSLSNNSISSNTGTITQLNSVTWLGSAGDGLWATASNWANGAIPDQNNVATVIIPDGSTVNYQYDVLGQVGSAITNNGDLTLSGTTDFTFSNDVAGDGTIIFDADQVGDTLTLRGTSTMTGTVNIQEHTAIIAASNALGTATLRANDGFFSVSSGVTLNQLTTAGQINLTSDLNTNGDIVFGGNLVIAGGNGTDANNLDPLEINSNNNDITFNGTVTAGSASKANFRSLNINAGTGEVNINDRFGYAFNGVTYSNLTSTNLWQLNVTAAAINLRADVMTFERQTYNGAMFVGDNGTNGLTRTLLSVDPEVIINGTVDDLDPNTSHTLVTKAVSLNTDTPVVNVTGEVGATNPLVNWIAETGRQNTAEEWGNITTGTSGTLTYQGDTISGGAQTLAASEQSGYVAPTNTTTDSTAQNAGSIAGRFKQAYRNIVSNTTEKFREIRQKTMIGIGVKILDDKRDCDASGANDCKSTITIRGMLDQLIRKLWIRFA